jgi:polygalacturonase
MRILFLILILAPVLSSGQGYIVRDIKSFGAKGDGITNDQEAFETAALFFNERHGNGKLIISKGTYLVGRQEFTGGQERKPAYEGADVVVLKDCSNMDIVGKNGAKIVYADSLRFGTFDPVTGERYDHGNGYFTDYSHAAFIGHCIYISYSSDIRIDSLEIDGNNGSVILGGKYGDAGRQLPHYGIFISNSQNVTISRLYVHHFALDGICISNGYNYQKDSVTLLNSRFEYNSRQGCSWIGGNDLKVTGCTFAHTGRGRFNSPPGAGLDIEEEVGTISGGVFENTVFENNTGCGLVADAGQSRNCSFKDCTFWGVTSWSVWVNKPGFSFTGCNIYGSVVHGYDAANVYDATKFTQCHFEDLPYKGRAVYGEYLLNTNNRKRVSFTDCDFIAHRAKLCWISAPASWNAEEKYTLRNCRFVLRHADLKEKDFAAVIRGIRYSNCSFSFTHPDAKAKQYYLNDCCENFNVNEGGNITVFSNR